MNAQKLKITPTKITENSVRNMNNIKSEKYGWSPEKIEKRSLAGEQFKAIFNMHGIEFIINLTDIIENITLQRERS